jgi:hypothetical protein
MGKCEPAFWEDPLVIFKYFHLRYDAQCKHQVWNFAIRLLLLAVLVGLIGVPLCGSMSLFVSIFFACIIGFIVLMTTGARVSGEPRVVTTIEETALTPTVSSYVTRDRMIANEARREGHGDGLEGFTNPKAVADPGIITRIVGVEATLPNVNVATYAGPALPDYTPPSARNPFMNILLDEYKYDPTRAPAVSVSEPSVKQTFDDYFRVQWFSDPTDVFGRNQSQRQFVTQPSTSIPNDRESYQNWLYKIPGKTCKEGGRDACLAGTDGSPVTWLNQDL